MSKNHFFTYPLVWAKIGAWVYALVSPGSCSVTLAGAFSGLMTVTIASDVASDWVCSSFVAAGREAIPRTANPAAEITRTTPPTLRNRKRRVFAGCDVLACGRVAVGLG